MLIAKGWRPLTDGGMESPRGITQVEGNVRRTDGSGSEVTVELMVDSGATYSVLPEDVVRVRATSPVILGHSDEGPLLEAVTLETLGLVLHPLRRQLTRTRLLLGRLTA